jgi:hypothetical protein
MGKKVTKCPECDSTDIGSNKMTTHLLTANGHQFFWDKPHVVRRHFCIDCETEFDEMLREDPPSGRGGCPCNDGSCCLGPCRLRGDDDDEDDDYDDDEDDDDGLRSSRPKRSRPSTDQFVVTFQKKAADYGLTPQHLNSEFVHKSVTYILLGLRPRSKKAPIAVKRKDTDQIYFIDVLTVHKALNIPSEISEKLATAPAQVWAKQLREHAEKYGLTPQHYGKTISWKGTTYTIAGVDVGRRKNPIALQTVDGRYCHAPVGLVKRALQDDGAHRMAVIGTGEKLPRSV